MCLLADNGTRVAHAQASLTIASQSVCALPVSIQQTNYMPEEEQSSSAVNSEFLTLHQLLIETAHCKGCQQAVRK